MSRRTNYSNSLIENHSDDNVLPSQAKSTEQAGFCSTSPRFLLSLLPNLVVESRLFVVATVAQNAKVAYVIGAAVHQRDSVVNFELASGSANQTATAVTFFDFLFGLL